MDRATHEKRPPRSRRWASLVQASEYSGFDMRTLRNRIAAGDLPAYKPKGSRVYRVDLNELDDMIVGNGRISAGHLQHTTS